jgi:O-antigen/teichoic acid export membrane protein
MIEEPATPPSISLTRRIDTGGLSLRAFAARGVIVNTTFDVGLSALGLIRGFVLATLLTRYDYGVWGVLVVSLGVLARLKLVGVGDKYIQQEEPDQERAFQHAFTLEVLMTAAAMVPVLVAIPIVALVYGHTNLIAPGLVLVTVMAAGALQAPLWIPYREMNFVRQRVLSTAEPVIGFIVAVVLAALGAGYWALAAGVAVGAWSGALVAILASPYKLRWRYDKASLRVYRRFSGPVLVATVCSVVLANGAAIATNIHLGLAGVGVLALAATITTFTTKVDDLVSGTLYPAICAIQNRMELLRESFVKSNRLALMWAMPFGLAITLFAGDLVHFAIGQRWDSAISLLAITGAVAAISHIGFNWDDYFRARGETMPLAVAGVAATITFLGVGIPLLFAYGLPGLAAGIAAQAAVHLAFRAWYLSKLFDGFRFVRHAVRAVLPTIPAALLVLIVRQLERGPRTAGMAIAELCGYVATTVAATWLFEGSLVREAAGYVLARAVRPSPPAARPNQVASPSTQP